MTQVRIYNNKADSGLYTSPTIQLADQAIFKTHVTV